MPHAKSIASQRMADQTRACFAPGYLLMRDSAGDRPELGLATPFRVTRCSVARSYCYGLRRSALPAFLPGISGGRHFGARIRAHDYYCANRPLPVQPQSDLCGFHSACTRIVRLVQYSLAARNACPSCRHHCDGCDSTRRTIPRTQLQRPVFKLQGSGPSLVVRANSPSLPAIDR